MIDGRDIGNIGLWVKGSVIAGAFSERWSGSEEPMEQRFIVALDGVKVGLVMELSYIQ